MLVVPTPTHAYQQIPSLFVKRYLQEYAPKVAGMKLPNKAVSLEGPSGKLWPVSICGPRLSSFGFKTGWRKFAIDHSLAVGDVIVFKKISNDHFVVQIFGKFGLEKAFCDHSDIKTYHGKRKDRQEAKADCSKELNKKLKTGNLVSNVHNKENVVALCSRKLASKPCKKKDAMVKSNSFDMCTDGFMVLDEEQRGPARELFPEDKALADATSQHHQSITHSLPSQQIAEGLRVPKKMSEEKVTKLYIVVSQRRPVSQAEKEKALNAAKAFKTNQPAFKKIMMKSNVYKGFWLSFPSSFAAEYLPSEIQPVTLMNPAGKEWRAKLLGCRSNPGLSGGWKRFSIDNQLEEGDVCIFELIDRMKLCFKVHICRVVGLNEGCSKTLGKPQLEASRKGSVRGSLKNANEVQLKQKTDPNPNKHSPFVGKMRGAISYQKGERTKELPLKEKARGAGSEHGENVAATNRVLTSTFSMLETSGQNINTGKKGMQDGIPRGSNLANLPKGDHSKSMLVVTALPAQHMALSIVHKTVRQELSPEYQISKLSLPMLKVKEELDIEEAEPRKPTLHLLTYPTHPHKSVVKSESFVDAQICSQAPDDAKEPLKQGTMPAQTRNRNRKATNTSTLGVSDKELNLANADEKTYYEVERLINRRKGRTEDEFLVLLGEQAQTIGMSLCDKEDGGWWVPFSHFKLGFKTCHL